MSCGFARGAGMITIAEALEKVSGLTGPIGRLIAILAVVAAGYMMFTGRLNWPLFLAIFFGVVLVFSAATIIDGFAAP
ncbi:MAG: TrbC/VirB2 family protein [Brevundimonas sp.]